MTRVIANQPTPASRQEVRLWRAVLGQLIKDIGIDPRLRKGDLFRYREEAHAYFAPDNRDELETLCEAAMVNPDVVISSYRSGDLEAQARAMNEKRHDFFSREGGTA